MERPIEREPDRPWQWQRGNPGRPTNVERRRRIELEAIRLADEFGGWDRMSAVDRLLLNQAAAVALRRPKSAEDVVRVANSVGRLLGGLRKRHGKSAGRSATFK